MITGMYDAEVIPAWGLPMPHLLVRLSAAAQHAIHHPEDDEGVAMFEALADIADQRARGGTLGHPLRHLRPVR